MKKSVLLGIVAVVLFALPALAGEKKIEGWQGYWTWFAQPVKDFPIKMKIPWFIDITNQEGWEIQLEQVECAALGPAYIAEWPCFRGSRDLIVAVNFNCTLLCGINKTYLAGNWGCSMNPEDIDICSRQAVRSIGPVSTASHKPCWFLRACQYPQDSSSSPNSRPDRFCLFRTAVCN